MAYYQRIRDSLRYIKIPDGDDVLYRLKAAEVENKIIKANCTIQKNVTNWFSAGSNSTVNTLRYLIPMAAVATAAGEPESNVAYIIDIPIRIKRIRYIIGSNTKNNTSNISLRADFVDIAESVLSINASQNTAFDSGVISKDYPTGTKFTWKWDTSLSTTGGITIIYSAMFEYDLI